jgi:hypothetical protein
VQHVRRRDCGKADPSVEQEQRAVPCGAGCSARAPDACSAWLAACSECACAGRLGAVALQVAMDRELLGRAWLGVGVVLRRGLGELP